VKIKGYSEFGALINEVGFMPFGNNCIDFLNLSALTLEEKWHTGLEDDPWLWRIKIEDDTKAAYAKLFDKKPGFISPKWYPKFLAARRKGRSFQEVYAEGILSNYAKQIYELFDGEKILAVHEIKALAGFTKEQNAKYESAMTELQMGMFITVRGTKQKVSAKGELYGWPSTAYATVETWAGEQLIEEANGIDPKDAMDEIIQRTKEIVPTADSKKMKRFLGF
jgi:hypothetical protein